MENPQIMSDNFISFDYHKTNEINTYKILENILRKFNLPECIIENIEEYLFHHSSKNIKIFYEKKCDDYRTSRETTFKIFKVPFYDFIVSFIKTIMMKYFALKQTTIIPHMRQDIYYFTECYMNDDNYLINKSFFLKNKLAFLVLFCEIYNDFKSCDTYYCLYYNTYSNMNDKYIEYFEKIKDQIVF